MRYSVVREKATEIKGDLLVCGVTKDGVKDRLEGLDRETSGLFRRAFATGEMKGKLLETTRFHMKGRAGSPQYLIMGLGDTSEIDVDTLRKAGGIASSAARTVCAARMVVDLKSFCYKNINPEIAASALAEGAGLSLYRFLEHKSDNKEMGIE